MAVSMRKAAVQCSARAQPSRAVVCKAVQGDSAASAKLAVASFAAAALLASPAQAGVVLEQPQLKKVFQDSAPSQPAPERPFRLPGAKSAAPAAAPATKAEEKKKDSEPLGNFGLDPRAVALPGSIAAIAGLGLVASKVDGGFNEWINESGALVRNSAAYAGFETDIKGEGGAVAAGTRKTGTKKVGTVKKSKK